MEDLITFGSLVGGTWALSLFGLKSIRDSAEAEEPLKDAAAAAIIAVNFIAGMAASVYLGWNLDNDMSGAVVAGFIFLVPFIAMASIYFHAKWRTRWVSKLAKRKQAEAESEAKVEVKAKAVLKAEAKAAARAERQRELTGAH